ncbi:MAG: ABC transporter permease [Spirochaetaceae bacterium]
MSNNTESTDYGSWRLNKPAALALVVSAVGIASRFFIVREHRLDAGSGYSLLSDSVVLALAVAVLSLLATVAASYRGGVTPRKTGLVVAGVGLVFLPWLVAGVSGAAILAEQDLELGRIAPAAGFWFLTLAGVILLSEGLRDIQGWLPALVVTAVAGGITALFAFGLLEDIAFIREFRVREDRFAGELVSHVRIAASAVGLAVVVGVPGGVAAYRYQRIRKPVFSLVNGLQTIPSLALFGLMIAPLAFLSQRFPLLRQMGIRGVGNAPAIIALFLYSLLPILRNTYTSLSVMDPAVIDAGRGMGMTRRQLLRMVEVPIALPIILSGVRVASVQTIGNTTVAALIGAGGLGNFVFQGLGQAAPDLIITGVIPIVLLAIVVDRFFGFLIYHIVPGVRA